MSMLTSIRSLSANANARVALPVCNCTPPFVDIPFFASYGSFLGSDLEAPWYLISILIPLVFIGVASFLATRFDVSTLRTPSAAFAYWFFASVSNFGAYFFAIAAPTANGYAMLVTFLTTSLVQGISVYQSVFKARVGMMETLLRAMAAAGVFKHMRPNVVQYLLRYINHGHRIDLHSLKFALQNINDEAIIDGAGAAADAASNSNQQQQQQQQQQHLNAASVGALLNAENAVTSRYGYTLNVYGALGTDGSDGDGDDTDDDDGDGSATDTNSLLTSIATGNFVSVNGARAAAQSAAATRLPRACRTLIPPDEDLLAVARCMAEARSYVPYHMNTQTPFTREHARGLLSSDTLYDYGFITHVMYVLLRELDAQPTAQERTAMRRMAALRTQHRRASAAAAAAAAVAGAGTDVTDPVQVVAQPAQQAQARRRPAAAAAAITSRRIPYTQAEREWLLRSADSTTTTDDATTDDDDDDDDDDNRINDEALRTLI